MTESGAPLIVGLGNRLRGDDGAGVAVAKLIAARRPELAPLPYEGEPLGLLELWDGVEEAILIDAVAGERPGRIHRLTDPEQELRRLPSAGSTHLHGLAETLELCRVLGRVPPRLTVIGIEAQRFALGTGLTPPVRRAAETVAAALLAELTPVATAVEGAAGTGGHPG